MLTLLKKTYRRKGALATLSGGLRTAAYYVGTVPAYFLSRYMKRPAWFEFNGDRLHYFYHPYHATWMNERAVEIPIVRTHLRRQGRVLEVGNVLKHYEPIKHEVLDKYENASGVINQDVIDYNPSNLYDLIISISTIEHVGWDETPRDATKIIVAIRHLRSMLAPSGILIVTLPVGYNPNLDELLDKGELTFTHVYCMKRISRLNHWVQTDWSVIRDSKYGHPFPAANALVVGIASGL